MRYYVVELNEKDCNEDLTCMKWYVCAGPMTKEQAEEMQLRLFNENSRLKKEVREALEAIRVGKEFGPIEPVRLEYKRLVGISYLHALEEDI